MYENKEEYFGVPVPLKFLVFFLEIVIFSRINHSYSQSFYICTKVEFGKRAGCRTFFRFLSCRILTVFLYCRYCPCLGPLRMAT
jgi:hypothetical protein